MRIIPEGTEQWPDPSVSIAGYSVDVFHGRKHLASRKLFIKMLGYHYEMDRQELIVLRDELTVLLGLDEVSA